MAYSRRMRVSALVFDVLGTVVDEDGSVRRAVAQLVESAGLPATEIDWVAEEWSQRLSRATHAVSQEETPWQSGDVLRRAALADTLAAHPEISVTPDAVAQAGDVGHRLEPWPDSVAAIARLAKRFPVIALTNGGRQQSADMSARAGLPWTHLLTGDDAEQFKPHPAMYRLPLERLELVPADTLFVAAHPWDLDGAAEYGYRTALVLRPGVSAAADAYDLQVADLGALADRLGA